jgi:accessory colonization factor AcfC
VPQIARWKLYADDLPPEVVEDIENKKAEIKAIRERNNMQLYAHEYEAALKQQQEQQQHRLNHHHKNEIRSRLHKASCLMKDKVLSKQTQLTQ